MLASLGPFFEVSERDDSADSAGWQPIADFCNNAAAVRERTLALAARLRLGVSAADLRAAGSVAHLGMATRLASPLFALALMGRRVGTLWWTPSDTSTYAVAIDPGSVPSSSALLDVMSRISLAHNDMCPSSRILAGNVTSAISGAALIVARQAPAVADRCATLADELCRLSGDTTYGGRGGTEDFRRGTCCLLYRASGSLCPDCLLHEVPPVAK